MCSGNPGRLPLSPLSLDLCLLGADCGFAQSLVQAEHHFSLRVSGRFNKGFKACDGCSCCRCIYCWHHNCPLLQVPLATAGAMAHQDWRWVLTNHRLRSTAAQISFPQLRKASTGVGFDCYLHIMSSVKEEHRNPHDVVWQWAWLLHDVVDVIRRKLADLTGVDGGDEMTQFISKVRLGWCQIGWLCLAGTWSRVGHGIEHWLAGTWPLGRSRWMGLRWRTWR
ncbi:hypothetical protein Hamer_G012292 [Homarus americanus]|uniref:Uncharacterized protein n=1 Tax=Homarus americanus TaxID=6706 RepID=A0A8J5KEK4_HOMAM|nr:hypothetical protein Hamer_G012292 [Homarus americanus]